MKNMLRIAVIFAILLGASALPARADSGATLSYSLSGPVTASWTMSQDPTALFSSGEGFLVVVPNLKVDGKSDPDYIAFFSSGDMGGLNTVLTAGIPDLTGAQLFTNGEVNPIMSIGTFDLIGPNGSKEILTVKNAAMPEPGTLLLLSAGLLVVLAAKRNRLLAPVR